MKTTAGAWDELYAAGTISDALRYAALLWPDFSELGGMVFLNEERSVQPDLEDPLATLTERFDGDRSEMEREFNLIEIPTLFASIGEGDLPEVHKFASILRAAWEAKLAIDFPDRTFVVETLTGEIDDPTLRFFMVR